MGNRALFILTRGFAWKACAGLLVRLVLFLAWQSTPAQAEFGVNGFGFNSFGLGIPDNFKRINEVFEPTRYSHILKFVGQNRFAEANTYGQILPLRIVNGVLLLERPNLLGSLIPERETVTQFRDFLLLQPTLNRDQQLFLARNGGINFAGTIDLDLGGETKAYGQVQGIPVAAATLNFLMNAISFSPQLWRLYQNQVSQRGLTRLNLASLIPFLGVQNMNILFNPGELMKTSYACTGRVKLGWMVDRIFGNAPNYYATQRIPLKDAQLERFLGINTDIRATPGQRILVAGDSGEHQSIVAVRQDQTTRILSFFNSATLPGRAVWKSLDFNATPTNGSQYNSQDPRQNPLNPYFAASEWLFQKPNYFLSAALFNDKGDRVDEAPASVARTGAIGGNTAVVAGGACFRCHSSGSNGGGISSATQKPYHENLGSIPGFARQFYTSNPAYYKKTKLTDSVRTLSAMIKSGSYIPDPTRNVTDSGTAAPLISDTLDTWRKPLSLAKAARELGTTVARLSAALSRLNPRLNVNGSIDRNVFEESFCTIRQMVSATPPLPQQQLRPRLPAQVHGAPPAYYPNP